MSWHVIGSWDLDHQAWCGITSRQSPSLIRDNVLTLDLPITFSIRDNLRRLIFQARLYNNRYHFRGSSQKQPSPCSTTIQDGLWDSTPVRYSFSSDPFRRNWVMTTAERSCLVSNIRTPGLGRGLQGNKGLGQSGKC